MEWAEYSSSMFEKFRQAGKPFQATYEMTPLCNFRCNMCYVRLDPEQAKAQGKMLSTEQWLQIASDSRKMGTTILEVTGGEAVTRPDFPVLYEAFIKMGFLIHLRSNGYLIRDGILDLLKKYKPRRISVTMYGASDEMYQKVCDVSDGFSVVSRNVLAMRDAGLNIRLVMTVTNDNREDIGPLRQWAKDHDLKITPYGGLFTPVRAAKRSIDHLQVQIQNEEYELTEEEMLSAQEYEPENRESLLKPFWLCRGFGAKCCISWDGRMTICNTMTAVWADVVKNGYEKAFHELNDKLEAMKRPSECASCPFIEYCDACPARIMSATGDPERTCESICKMARKRYKRNYLLGGAGQAKQKGIITDECAEGADLNED